MNNINIYNQEMAKAIEDKLWFKGVLDLSIFKGAQVFDLGCADGELIRHLAPMYPENQFIGLDTSEEMIKLARRKQMFPNESYKIGNSIKLSNPRFLIMSSVFHEILAYQAKRDYLELINPDYILFRDMMVSESTCRFSRAEDVEKAMKHDLAPSFVEQWGDLTIQKKLIHFLLKYRFRENWDREVKENYLPINMEELESYFPGYNVIYKKHYTLPFVHGQVMKDFGIDLKDNTHVNVIFKRK